MPPTPDRSAALEDLLAEALAKFDEGGEAAMAAFVAAHAEHASALDRGILRCREMGLLGTQASQGNAAPHPERLGDYRLVRRIGGGGMGVVYEAQQEPFGRRVALKIIKPELLYFEGARERFRREVDAIAKLEHPAIVSVFDAGEHEGVPYFTMEMLDGVTLEQACVRLRERDPAELGGEDLRALVAPADATGELFTGSWWEVAVRIGTQVALGLRHAHLRGIVHRDVKPSNIVVTPHGRAIVLDFGVAQVRTAADLTRSGATPGSPAFMSPEQRRGMATDERTDVFSLAACLWQLLTLQRPFRDADHPKGAPALRKLRTQNRAAPPELDLVLRTAMDPDRDQRYGDMGLFAADLQAVLERRPIRARPLGMRLRLLRWCQRHRTAATVGAALFGAAAVMLVVLLLVQDASRRALQRTNGELAIATAALESARERVQHSLDTTLEALHSVQVRLGNDRLLAVPQAQNVAHAVLQEAADLFRGLLQRHADDENVRWRAARAVQALALSHDRRGDTDLAVELVLEALAILGTDPSCSLQIRNIRGHAWKTLGSFRIDLADRAGAGEALARAEADFLHGSTDAAQQADNLRALAAIATTRTFLFDERKEPERVEQLHREALHRQRDCMAKALPTARDRVLLVHYLGNVGKFLQRSNRAEEALPVLEEALRAIADVPAEGVWPPTFVLTAEVHEAIGNCHVNRKDPQAESSLRAALEARERATRDFPDVLEFRIRLGGATHNLGRWLHSLARTDEALAMFQQATTITREALQRSPTNAMALDFARKHLEMAGYCHSLKKDVAGLLATAHALAEVPGKDPQQALRVADFLLRAWFFDGKGDGALLDEAMGQLVVAEQRGLTAQQLPAKGFEALAGRDDYVQWRERIGKVGPAAK